MLSMILHSYMLHVCLYGLLECQLYCMHTCYSTLIILYSIQHVSKSSSFLLANLCLMHTRIC